jgi:hypothetical protein
MIDTKSTTDVQLTFWGAVFAGLREVSAVGVAYFLALSASYPVGWYLSGTSSAFFDPPSIWQFLWLGLFGFLIVLVSAFALLFLITKLAELGGWGPEMSSDDRRPFVQGR